MCDPTGGILTAMVISSVVSTGVSMYSQREQAKAQIKATDNANALQAEQISDQTGVELSERARAARRERGSARVLAGEAGVNLGSGSFLAQLQGSAMNQYNDSGLILQNEKSQQASRQAQTDTLMSNIWKPSAGEMALTIGAAGVSTAASGAAAYGIGAPK